MVVDPDIAARRYMAAKFIDLKYRVDYAESGEQALEMIKDHRYNAIFVETNLPGIDGYEMCRILKARPDRRRIALVFVSARSSTFDRVKGAMAGCDAYLAKPIDQDKLVSTLDKFLPHWRLQLPIV
jgi:twitching motility two-component system response regulator PilG